MTTNFTTESIKGVASSLPEQQRNLSFWEPKVGNQQKDTLTYLFFSASPWRFMPYLLGTLIAEFTFFLACRCMDVWMCGCVDVWMCGCVDVLVWGGD